MAKKAEGPCVNNDQGCKPPDNDIKSTRAEHHWPTRAGRMATIHGRKVINWPTGEGRMAKIYGRKVINWRHREQ